MSIGKVAKLAGVSSSTVSRVINKHPRVAVETARLGYLRAAWLKDHGRPYKVEASIAKLYVSEMAVTCAREAVQVHGGYGFIEEFPVARFYRDAKVLEIGEGTSEIQRLLIARDLGLPGTEL